jgi:hypothetical protein
MRGIVRGAKIERHAEDEIISERFIPGLCCRRQFTFSL